MVIVSSGAVGVGAQRLGLHARPSKLPQKQALAAVGQVHLMRFYDDFFSAIGLVSRRVNLHPGCGDDQAYNSLPSLAYVMVRETVFLAFDNNILFFACCR